MGFRSSKSAGGPGDEISPPPATVYRQSRSKRNTPISGRFSRRVSHCALAVRAVARVRPVGHVADEHERPPTCRSSTGRRSIST
ncbi:hypothetical protein C9J85_11280 [Haloferax sp. wsp5]|nr:hypothetical protein C9J85_11280 [Haloferax sp. wsp5]